MCRPPLLPAHTRKKPALVRDSRSPSAVASALRRSAALGVQVLLQEAGARQAEAAYYTPALTEVLQAAIKFYLQAVGTADGAFVLLPGEYVFDQACQHNLCPSTTCKSCSYMLPLGARGPTSNVQQHSRQG